jgi:uncharacterized protein
LRVGAPEVDAPLWLIVLGAAIGGFVQGLSGFGFSLTVVGLWAWALPPPLAAVLAVFGGLTGQLIAAFTSRRSFDAPTVMPFIAGGLVGIPIGLWLLPRIDAISFRVLVGAVLASWCPVMLMSKSLPKLGGGRLSDAVAGVFGGLMGPLGGLTGAAPTLWCVLRGYERDAQRAVIQNFNMTMLAVSMASYVATGVVTRPMWPLMGVVAASLLLPVLVGMRVYKRISADMSRKVVLALLTLSGLALLLGALPLLLRRA